MKHNHESPARAIVALILLLLAIAVLPTPARAGAPGLVVIGDSLSDPGNVFLLTGQLSTAPYAPIPAGHAIVAEELEFLLPDLHADD